MSQPQASARTGASRAGLNLKALLVTGQVKHGDAIYVETWEYQNGAYISRHIWGIVALSSGTTTGFFVGPKPRGSGEWAFVGFESIKDFQLFELKASTLEIE